MNVRILMCAILMQHVRTVKEVTIAFVRMALVVMAILTAVVSNSKNM